MVLRVFELMPVEDTLRKESFLFNSREPLWPVCLVDFKVAALNYFGLAEMKINTTSAFRHAKKL